MCHVVRKEISSKQGQDGRGGGAGQCRDFEPSSIGCATVRLLRLMALDFVTLLLSFSAKKQS